MSIRRPVQLSEFKLTLKELSDPELLQIRKEITNTINKLNELILLMYKEKTQIRQQYEKHSPGESEEQILNDDDEATKEYKKDIQLYNESIQENKYVLRNNYERSEILTEEISKRGLELQDPGVGVYSLEELAKEINLSNEEYLHIKETDTEVFEINESQRGGGSYV